MVTDSYLSQLFVCAFRAFKCTFTELVHQRNFLSICGISCCFFFSWTSLNFMIDHYSFQKWSRHVNYTVICLPRERSGQWLINYIHQRFLDSCKFKKRTVTSLIFFFIGPYQCLLDDYIITMTCAPGIKYMIFYLHKGYTVFWRGLRKANCTLPQCYCLCIIKYCLNFINDCLSLFFAC